jgi:hypothetical protein
MNTVGDLQGGLEAAEQMLAAGASDEGGAQES